MSKPVTYVALVLDKSGSMGNIRQQTVTWYNEQVQQYKENAKDQDIKVCLVTFNGNVFEHLWLEPANALTESSVEEYVPNGGTAMRDALAFTIQKLRDTTTPSPEDAYLVICISDGDSRDDKFFKQNDLKALVDEVKKTNQWTFSFMGCEEHYLYQLARETGVAPSNFAAWDKSSVYAASAGMKNANSRSYKYFDDRKIGMTSSATYMNDQINVVADFTVDSQEQKKKLNKKDLADYSSPRNGSLFTGTVPTDPILGEAFEVPKPCTKQNCCGGLNHGTPVIPVILATPAKEEVISLPQPPLASNTKYSVSNTATPSKTVFGSGNQVNFSK